MQLITRKNAPNLKKLIMSRELKEQAFYEEYGRLPTEWEFKNKAGWAIPKELLLWKIREGLEATKTHSSHTEPDREVPDWHARHKYLQTALEIQGLKEVEGTSKIANITVVSVPHYDESGPRKVQAAVLPNTPVEGV